MPSKPATSKPATSKPAVLQLGPITVTAGTETPDRMAILLWGPSTAGKTTFAATAPGKKLWISFGDNEHVSVSNRQDVIVANVSDMRVDDLFKHAQSDNPFGLDNFLQENTDVHTVVVDSLTAIEYRALQKAVADKIGAGRGFTPTMEAPGISAYGGRNAIVLETVTGLLRVTAKHNVHIIITAHEADPTMVDGGNGKEIIDYISIMLGGKLVNSMTWRLSEIWFLSQQTTGDKHRQLMVRPTRKRRPVKTRMFDTKGDPEFVLHYDADKPDDTKGQMTIANWYDAWMDNGKARIPVPKKG
jgi:hypothetical protein